MDLQKSISIGEEMYQFITELYPICRSITGEGLRETLELIDKHIDIETHNIPSGTDVFDWVIPKEWNIRDAYIMNSNGEKVIEFKKSNLHVVNYSIPVNKKMQLAELKEHLFTLPEHPEWIPYKTSYYEETWGFCLSHNQLEGLAEGEYEVCIDSSLEDGFLTYGECYLQGERSDEVLISCHICHPSLCNDNLSGIAVSTFLAKHLSSLSLRYSYRFLFIPGTIGSITWLAKNEFRTSQIKHGLVLAGVGDPGKLTYKRSRRSDADIDRAAENVITHSGQEGEIIDFYPSGYDERQFCSPGFNLPIGSLMRTPHGQYPEYHTSADDLNLVVPKYIADTFFTLTAILDILETNTKYLNLYPKCEPQLGKRGVYSSIAKSSLDLNIMAILWVLNLSDGQNNLLDIAERADMSFKLIKNAANALVDHELLREIPI